MSAQHCFANLMVRHPTFHLLWKLDEKTGKPIEPTVSFTPAFPGEGFNHSVQLRAGAMEEYTIKCPCGTGMKFLAKESTTATAPCDYVASCPVCLSWHSVVWIPVYAKEDEVKRIFY